MKPLFPAFLGRHFDFFNLRQEVRQTWWLVDFQESDLLINFFQELGEGEYTIASKRFYTKWVAPQLDANYLHQKDLQILEASEIQWCASYLEYFL